MVLPILNLMSAELVAAYLVTIPLLFRLRLAPRMRPWVAAAARRDRRAASRGE